MLRSTVLWLLACACTLAQPAGSSVISTFAGTDFTFPRDPIAALSANLSLPRQMALDGQNLYVAVSQNEQIFKITSGDPGSQSILISNLGADTLSFGSAAATVDGRAWLQYQPSAGVAGSSPAPIVVQPSLSGLPAGVYRGAVTLVFSDGSVRGVAVLLVVAPSGTASPASVKNRETTSGCTPTRLLPLATSLGSNFSVPAAYPAAIEVTVVDDCGVPMSSGAVVTSFSNGDIPISLNNLRNGRWAATWVSRTAAPQVTLSIAAELRQPALRGTTTITGTLAGNADPPQIRPGSVVSLASLVEQAPLAPGGLISIFGRRLSQGEAASERAPLDLALAGTEVLLGGRSVPLISSSDGRINAVLPSDLPINARLQMLVQRGDQLSVPEEVAVAAAQPAVFTADRTGAGAALAYVRSSDGALQPVRDNVPQAGATLVLFAAGLGAVDAAIPDGHAPPAGTVVRTVNEVSVSIGGIPARVLSSQLAGAGTPDAVSQLAVAAVGIYRIEVEVPSGIAAGEAVSLTVGVAGQTSPPVTIPVR